MNRRTIYNIYILDLLDRFCLYNFFFVKQRNKGYDNLKNFH